MIRMNDFARLWEETQADLQAALREVGESGWYILGRQLESFERSLAAMWGLPHAVGVASGLDAIEIALRALGCRPGDRVLTTPLSAFATTLAILKLGAMPIFADVDASGLLDLDAVEALLERDSGIRFAVPVHLYGHALPAVRLARLRDRFGLRIVEDCAQSIGASSGGQPTGSVGQAAATSFYPTKNLGALGDAGAILTADAALDAEVRILRDYGQSAKYCHSAIGYNSRLDELQAAFLNRVFLPRLDIWTARRRAIAELYFNGLRHPCVTPFPVPEGSMSCWHLFPVLVDGSREALAAHLRDRGVLSGEHYPVAIPDQPAMARAPHEIAGDLAKARRLAAHELSLPIHPFLDDAEVEQVIKAVNCWQA